MIPVPAFDLPPISRALKFADFDRLLARLVNDCQGTSGEASLCEADDADDPCEANRPASARAAERTGEAAQFIASPSASRESVTDYWSPGPTLLGGYEGEVAMAVPGAVPELELEG